jgi:hypothetical protein
MHYLIINSSLRLETIILQIIIPDRMQILFPTSWHNPIIGTSVDSFGHCPFFLQISVGPEVKVVKPNMDQNDGQKGSGECREEKKLLPTHPFIWKFKVSGLIEFHM